jgi:hypothetical protein
LPAADTIKIKIQTIITEPDVYQNVVFSAESQSPVRFIHVVLAADPGKVKDECEQAIRN